MDNPAFRDSLAFESATKSKTIAHDKTEYGLSDKIILAGSATIQTPNRLLERYGRLYISYIFSLLISASSTLSPLNVIPY